MTKDDKIYVKLQLEKSSSSGDIVITAHFDTQAPNYSKDTSGYKWYPTDAEIAFINEAFDLIPEYQSSGQHFTNKPKESSPSLPPPAPEPPQQTKPEPKPETKIEKPVETPDIEQVEKEQNNFDRIPLPEKPKEEPEKGEKSDEGEFEPIDNDSDIADDLHESDDKKSEEDKQILVEADGDTIDELIRKKTNDPDDDGLIVEADEKTIIDRVLKQKKKGKWARKE